MAFSDIQTNVGDILESGQYPDMSSTMIKKWINSAVRWSCEGQVIVPTPKPHLISHDFSFLVNEVQADTIDEQRKYDLPDGSTSTVWEFRKDKNVELINSTDYRVPLTKMFKRDIEDNANFAYLLGKGTPSVFCIEQFKLWLFCLPDHDNNDDEAWTINVEYYGYLPSLVEDTDTNSFTIKFPELIEWKAAALGFEWAKDTDAEQYYNNKAVTRLLEMITNDIAIDLGGIEIGMAPMDGQSLGVS